MLKTRLAPHVDDIVTDDPTRAERRAQEALYPVYERRRVVLKGISRFWPVALMNHNMFALHAQHNSDQVALSYLEDVWVARDQKESRCFTLEFVRCCQAMSRILADALAAVLQGKPVLFG